MNISKIYNIYIDNISIIIKINFCYFWILFEFLVKNLEILIKAIKWNSIIQILKIWIQNKSKILQWELELRTELPKLKGFFTTSHRWQVDQCYSNLLNQDKQVWMMKNQTKSNITQAQESITMVFGKTHNSCNIHNF